jgi:hypothetical protein
MNMFCFCFAWSAYSIVHAVLTTFIPSFDRGLDFPSSEWVAQESWLALRRGKEFAPHIALMVHALAILADLHLLHRPDQLSVDTIWVVLFVLMLRGEPQEMEKKKRKRMRPRKMKWGAVFSLFVALAADEVVEAFRSSWQKLTEEWRIWS